MKEELKLLGFERNINQFPLRGLLSTIDKDNRGYYGKDKLYISFGLDIDKNEIIYFEAADSVDSFGRLIKERTFKTKSETSMVKYLDNWLKEYTKFTIHDFYERLKLLNIEMV